MSQSKTSDSDSTKPRILHENLPFTPTPITTDERVAVLSRFLVPGDSLYMPEQEKNTTALISLYKEGKITVNDEVFMVDGRIASREEYIAVKKPSFWERGTLTHYQLAQKASYGHGSCHEACGFSLKLVSRLPLWEGGDGTCMRINMLNDTGQ
ncbi:hypothetical protein ACN38_g9726 [Penicillium nordicum]|uniref:Uncharacterized protein n=1 Tax=Penicillium nordicum TaxID=229535 RepID=A0A0M9WCA8_9EURO|nr:hypothetical protein ACN38_g9726 [Penicillium nordicum]